MRVLEDMCELLEAELKQIAKKEDITPQELDNAYKAVDIIKDIETIKAMKKSEGSYGDYSMRMPYSYDYSMEYPGGYSRARGGRDADNDGRYNESMARGYSRHDDREHLMEKIEEMQRKIDKMS